MRGLKKIRKPMVTKSKDRKNVSKRRKTGIITKLTLDKSKYVNKSYLDQLKQLNLDTNSLIISLNVALAGLYGDFSQLELLPLLGEQSKYWPSIVNTINGTSIEKGENAFDYLLEGLLTPKMLESLPAPYKNLDLISLTFYLLERATQEIYSVNPQDPSKLDELANAIEFMNGNMILIGELLTTAYIMDPLISKAKSFGEYKSLKNVDALMGAIGKGFEQVAPVFGILWDNFDKFQLMISHLYRYAVANSVNIKAFSERFIDMANAGCPPNNPDCRVFNECKTDFSSDKYDLDHLCGRGNSWVPPRLVLGDRKF